MNHYHLDSWKQRLAIDRHIWLTGGNATDVNAKMNLFVIQVVLYHNCTSRWLSHFLLTIDLTISFDLFENLLHESGIQVLIDRYSLVEENLLAL